MLLFSLAIIIFLSQDPVTGFIKDEGLEYGEFFLRLFPSAEESRDLDRGKGDNNSVHFRLYERRASTYKRSSSSKDQKNEYQIVNLEDLKQLPKGMSPNIPTMVIVTGFMANNNASFTKELVSVVREAGRWNVFLLDWHKLAAGPWYPWAVGNVQAVGRHLAKFLDSMAYAFEKSSKIPRSIFFKNLYVIGYSLGAHVAGVAGNHVTKGRIGRVTGLDPANPLIDRSESTSERLDASDAEFVDVIHTCGGFMGISEDMGHADFYPNRGTIAQPGCDDLLFQVGCSHRRSWQFFMESIMDPRGFEAVQCDTWEEFEKGECIRDRGSITNMGIGASTRARGKYYLRTNPSPPYSIRTN